MNSTTLRELIRHPGPFASVYLDFSHDTEDAARQLRLKWDSARAVNAERTTEKTVVGASHPLHKVPGGGPEASALRVLVAGEVTADVTAKRREKLLEEYQADAEQGLTAALREANAETLVVAPEVLESRTVWCSPTSPAQIGVDDSALRGLGLPDLTELPADEALPAAAIAVGATVVIAPVGMELADGVGVRPRHGPG